MAKQKTLPLSNHLDILDGLRGIAIALVVLFHIWQQSWFNHTIAIGSWKLDLNFLPTTGFLGVELFFFISAFCLTYPYSRHVLEGARFQTLKQFFYKRAIKILPSYYLAMALILIFFTPVYPSLWRGILDVLAHIFFVHNLTPYTYGTISGVFWSLGVEVQFYLLFPVLCWMFRKKPILTFIGMTCVSLAYRIIVLKYFMFNVHFLFNQMPAFLDIFACGMMASYLVVWIRSRVTYRDKLKPIFTALSVTLFAIFGELLIWLFQIRYVKLGFQTWQLENRTYLALVFLALTVFSAFSYQFWRSIIANKVLVFLSVISYNLYLYHQFIGQQLIKYNVIVPKTVTLHASITWQRIYTVCAIAIGIAFATLITYFYERPILRNGFRNYITGKAFRKKPVEEKAPAVN